MLGLAPIDGEKFGDVIGELTTYFSRTVATS